MWWRKRRRPADPDEVDRRLDAVRASAEDPNALARNAARLLEGITADSYPDYWGLTLMLLAKGLIDRGVDVDLPEARAALLDAAPFLERRTVRIWAKDMRKLGIAFNRRELGDRAQNVEYSLACFRDALDHVDPDEYPDLWVELHHSTAIALHGREVGDRAVDTEQVLDHLHQADRVLVPDEFPDLWADVQYTLGYAHYDRVAGDRRQNLDRAIEHFERAYTAWSPTGDPANRGHAARSLGLAHHSRHNIGHNAHDLRRAEEYLEESLHVLSRDRFPQNWAASVEMLATLRVDNPPEEGRTEFLAAQVEAIEKAAQVHREVGDEAALRDNRMHYAYALQQVDRYGGTDNQVARAATFDRLLEDITPDSAPHKCAILASRLGELLVNMGRWVEAADAFRTANRATNLMLSGVLTRAGHEERLREGSIIARWTSYVLARLGRLDEAVVVLEQSRARSLGELVGGDASALDELRAVNPALVDAYSTARERLRAVQDRDVSGSILDRWRISKDPLPDLPSAELAATAKRVRQLRHQVDVLVGRIRRQEGFQDFLRPPNLTTVAGAAEPDCPLAYINTTPWGTVTLLVTSGLGLQPGLEAIWAHDFTEHDIISILMSPADPEKAAIPYMSGFLMRQENLVETRFEDGSSAITRGPVFGTGASQRTGRDEDGGMWRLGQRVMAPLAEKLRHLAVTQVVLIPCGSLGQFPVHTAYHHDGADAPSLLDTVDVAIAPSARVLVRARARIRETCTQPTLAGAANPMPHPTPLAFATRELERIARLFTGASTVLANSHATRSAVMSSARTASHVHLACHGTYRLGDHSPRLQFEGGSEIGLVDILRDRPFAGARLVTLSACQSAIPSHRASVDEVDGLPSGIMSTGTPAVVATLWPVDDLSTTLLMERFYTLHLHGDLTTGAGPLPPHRALCAAQRWLRQVTAGELHDYFRAEPEFAAAIERSPSGTRYPAAEAARYALHFGLTEPDVRPFAESWFWAPFLLIGA